MKFAFLALAASLAAAPALAQDAASPTPEAATAQEAPATERPAPPTPATSAEVTDEQVKMFAGAALEIQEVNEMAGLDDAQKQEKAAAIVAESGLEADDFNRIALGSSQDPALLERIQLAAAAQAQSAPAPEAPAAPATPTAAD